MKLNSFKRGNPEHPAVILLHGLLGASRNLLRVQDAVAAAGFYTVAYDQRGHGNSEHCKADEYTLENMSADLIAVMDENKIERAHLVGHSMGGRVCMLTAAQYPTRVLSLSMLDVAPKVSDLAINTLHTIIDPLPTSYPSKDAAVEYMKTKLALTGRTRDLFEQFLLSNLRTGSEGMRWVFDLEGIRKSLLASIHIDHFKSWKRVECPILILRGENSEHFTARELDSMLEMKPNATAGIISGAGHWLHVDNPKETIESLCRFLTSV